MKLSEYARHPLSAAFPDHSPDEFKEFKADIQANGFSCPEITFHDGMIIDGWHRAKAAIELGMESAIKEVGMAGDNPVAFVISCNSHRRHLTPGQRSMIAAELSRASTVGQPKKNCDKNHNTLTQGQAADLMGTPREKVSQARKISDKAPEVAAAVRQGAINLSTANAIAKENDERIRQKALDAKGKEAKRLKELQKERDRKAKEKAAKAAAKAAAKKPSPILPCSCREMIAMTKAGSIDAIFTDPPYLKEYLPVWDELAEFAVHALRPGGLLLALTGQAHLLEMADRLRIDGLKYRWIVAYVFEKCRTQIHSANVSVGFKPFLAFTRTGASPKGYAHDTFKAVPKTAADKADHVWGQTEADMLAIAEEWLEPGWRVCDPFCGAGSLVVAAKRRGCEVSGCDIDETHVLTTTEKLK